MPDTHAPDTHTPGGSAAKLVAMANQIAMFFATQPGDRAAADIAIHLRKFWTPRMRASLIAHADAGGAGLSAAARAAVERLRGGERK